MRQTIRTLLAIEAYKFSGKELTEFKKRYQNKRDFEVDALPTFCLNDKGKVVRTEYYFYWDNDSDEKYVLFNIETADRLLSEEISNVGFDDLLEDVDLRPFLAEIHTLDFEDYRRTIPSASYFIIDLIYTSSFNGETTEYDFDAEITGVLKKDLSIVNIQQKLIQKDDK